NWKLALIALAITPVLIIVAYRYSHVTHPTLRDVQQKLADVATVAEENIVGVHVVKSFAQEPQESAKFHARSEAVFDQTVRANRQRALYVPFISWIPLLAQGAVLLVGARMVTSGELGVGGFVAFNLYLGMLVVPLRSLGMWIGQAQRATAAGDRRDLAGSVPVLGERPREHHLRRARSRRQRGRADRAARSGARVRRAPAGRLRDDHRRARDHALGRPAPAAGDRARAGRRP